MATHSSILAWNCDKMNLIVVRITVLSSGGTVVKNWQCRDVRHMGWISGSRRSPGGGHDNPPQYSCMENPMRSLARSIGSQRDSTEVT